jgi:hypothetical protein
METNDTQREGGLTANSIKLIAIIAMTFANSPQRWLQITKNANQSLSIKTNNFSGGII